MADEDIDSGDELDTGTLAQALGGMYGPATAEAQRAALDILKAHETQMKSGVQPEDEILGKMRASADEVRAALKSARARLMSQRNDRTEAMLAISAGLGRPTRFGTIGEAFGNMSEALQPVVRRRGEEDKELLNIDTSEAGVNNSVNAAEFQLAELKRRLGTTEALKALEVLKGGAGNRGNQLRDAKIRDTMVQLQGMGMPVDKAWARAVNIVDGREKMEVVPSTGNVRFTDLVTKRAEEVPLGPHTSGNGGGAPPAGGPSAAPGSTPGVTPSASTAPTAAPPLPTAAQPAPRPQQAAQTQPTNPLGQPSGDPRDAMRPGDMTMYDAAGLGTGLWSSIRQGWSEVAGNVGLPVASKTIQARQTLINNAQFMSRALTVDPNDPAYKEIQEIKNTLNLLPSWGDNPPVMRNSINTLDKQLRGLYQKAITDADDTSLPQDFRSRRKSLAASIRSFIPALGAREKPGDAIVPVGIPPEVASLWQYMTPEARERAMKKYGR